MSDDSYFYQAAIGIVGLFQVMTIGVSRAFSSRVSKLENQFESHRQYSQDTYMTKEQTMQEFSSLDKNFTSNFNNIKEMQEKMYQQQVQLIDKMSELNRELSHKQDKK